MESSFQKKLSEQTQLTNKTETDSQMRADDSQWWGVELEHRGIEQKGKRTHGHGQQSGEYWGEEGKRGLSGNGKKYNKD